MLSTDTFIYIANFCNQLIKFVIKIIAYDTNDY